MRFQWTGDNLAEIRQALATWGTVDIADKGRQTLRITAHAVKGAGFVVDADIKPVEIGETIEIRAGSNGMTDGIGIHRLPSEGPAAELVWSGSNYFEARRFVIGTGIDFTLEGEDLLLRTPELRSRSEYVRVRRGDKLFSRQTTSGKYLGVSRAGEDHRA